jgi:hypothetical protein
MGDNYHDRSFASQFQPDGDSFLYRYGGIGPAIRVTREERDNFVRDDSERSRSGIQEYCVSCLVLIAAFVFGRTYWHVDGYWLMVALLAPLPIMLVLGWRSGTDPRRLLEGRPFVEPIPTAAEIRRQKLARVSWTSLALPASMIGYSIWSNENETTSDWIWFGMAVLAGLFIMVQAVRKLWYGRSSN